MWPSSSQCGKQQEGDISIFIVNFYHVGLQGEVSQEDAEEGEEG